MNDVLVCTPSRGRPDRLRIMLDAVDEHSVRSEVAVYLDNDDPSWDDATWVELSVRTRACVVGPRWGLGRSTNALVKAFPEYAFYASLGDDHVPRTPGWDRLLVETITANGGTGIAYGNDLLQGEYIPTAPLISADIVQALGFMCPPQLRHMFVDRFWQELGNALGLLFYVSEVVIEHMHPAVGKAPQDDTYEATNNDDAFNADHAAFNHYMAWAFADDVARVRAKLDL